MYSPKSSVDITHVKENKNFACIISFEVQTHCIFEADSFVFKKLGA